MKVRKKQLGFKPFNIVITIESEEEEKIFKSILLSTDTISNKLKNTYSIEKVKKMLYGIYEVL